MFTFDSVSKILEDNVIFSIEKNYSQTFSYLTEKLNKVKKTSDLILTDDNINNMFFSNRIYSDIDNYYSMKKSMDFLCSFEDEDIIRIILFLKDNENYNLSSYFKSIDSVKFSRWYAVINENNKSLLWCPDYYLNDTISENLKQGSEYFALVRQFLNPANYSVNSGYYCIYFQAEPIKDIVDMGDAVNASVTFLMNSKGELIYASNYQQYEKLNDLFEKRALEESKTPLLKTFKADGKKLIYAQKQFANSDWNLYTMISYDDILSQIRLTQQRISIFTILISILCFVFAWTIARSLTKRIMQLQRKMKQAQHGNFNSEGSVPYMDEIGYLANTYDFMLTEIKKLMDERYKAGIQVKNLELKTLQEQINPHFLYNTLDTINWLAQRGNNTEVEKAISSLAEFYRLSLSDGNDEIPIRDELKRISSYVEIQNIRFSGKIHLVIDIDEEIGNYLILKLMLQPFVENSILHGIMNKPGKEGFIIIEAIIEDENITITIQDNGVGISEEVLNKLNADDEDSFNDSYGIKNVKRRIKLNYGEKCSITFSSQPGVGTTAKIIIPAKYNEPAKCLSLPT